MEPSLGRLQRQAIEHMRRYLAAPAEERTPIVREFARTLFEARQHFLRGDGEPDYAGRTHPYRRWVGEIYSEAGVPAENRNSIRSSVSWHLSDIMRESVDKDTLADHGLQPQTQSEAHQEHRKQDRAVVRALTSRDVAGGSLMAITAAATVLAKVDGAELANLDERAAEVAKATLEDLEATARRLGKRVAVRPVAEVGEAPLFSAQD
jgi:hypothetical protein